MSTPKPRGLIRIHGARQNNLRNLSLDLPLGELIVVTGVSGSGKSSLVFDTLYAEGQRRYVETFSPYARQFLDRMDRPQVDRIEGIPPAIAIDQTNPVRTSRSTVGTMTELNDHLKLLYARGAQLHCRGCGQPVHRDTAQSILDALQTHTTALGDPRVLLCFTVPVPESFSVDEVRKLLAAQGYVRFVDEPAGKAKVTSLTVIQDRLRLGTAEPARVTEALEAALKVGQGRVQVRALADDGDAVIAQWRWSSDLHCAACDLTYSDVTPSNFSFNSPLGACDTCKGFGRVIGIDHDLVIPDQGLTLAQGAIKPWQTPSGKECQDDLLRHAKTGGIPLNQPWRELSAEHRQWVLQGDGGKGRKAWYGVKGFFDYLERKAYKMHVRVMLSKYRSYTHCPTCDGARLKPDALLWRLGAYNIHELMLLPIDRCREFFGSLQLPPPLDEASDLVLGEIRARLAYLCEVGLAYLTLDRQSRTLSGGEVQRINLTTALGTSLVNTLFVLDEPSIGLHPRDMQRVIGVMHRLRDAGNSLVVVEHDPQIMLEADRILDMGPGAGEHGGHIVFQGTPEQMRTDPKSLTGAWLSGRKRIDRSVRRAATAAASQWLVLRGAREHNLQGIDLRVPLGRLVCITGVSGSGKSTLIQDVLVPALLKSQGKPTVAPGAFDALEGAQFIDEVMLVDQSPIGRTTRSNPASYVGAFDAIRALFAKLPDALERKYTAGTFSFNSGTGRCPSCSGNGFEHIEMQFLSDVYLRCGECNGTRYRAETLEIKLEGSGGLRASIADVLSMTVTEALAFFAADPAVLSRLAPLADVGLDYLRLGQPVPTLSGGEAQRLKLAGHLADAAGEGRKLLVFDEPTTGLHFEDVAKLLRAFDQLLGRGHTLLVIEHNLDVIEAADWLVDLGPEGGVGGGSIVAEGTPAQLRQHPTSHTGAALRAQSLALQSAPGVRDAPPRPVAALANAIVVHHAREHNLKDIDVRIPHGGFTVITGVSGSGKSTLAFDIIFNEGQRRYLESLNAYARQFVQPASRPDVDAVYGIPPTVAIEQRTSRGGRKSTVATLTEIHHFLRLLFVKLGTQHCPDCELPIEPQSAESIAARILKDHRGETVTLLAPLVIGRKGYYTDLAKWAAARGHTQLRVDDELLPTSPWPRIARFKEHTIELPLGEMSVTAQAEAQLRQCLAQALDLGKGVAHVLPAGKNAKTRVFSARRACPGCGSSFAELDPRLFSYNSAQGWCGSCFGTGETLEGFDAEQSGEERSWQDEPQAMQTCPDCDGARLNPTALAVRWRDKSISQYAAQSVDESAQLFKTLKLDGREAAIARDISTEIQGRLGFLSRVGLGYLTLNRAAPTLSGGETQRIRLAAQLGSNLQGVCYVLDEPTIGLHPRDNRVLLDALRDLAGERNTLVVVEHDEETIRRADHVIDLGPGAGTRGGCIVGEGTVDDLIANPNSVTGRCLREPLQHPAKPRRPVKRSGTQATAQLTLHKAKLHNIAGIDVQVPLGRLVVITGVSGSGKSTLARDILQPTLAAQLARKPGSKAQAGIGCARISGTESLERVLEVDQTPIGKTPRSCPATYVGFWDAIRRIYAGTTEAGIRGWTTSRFSFNTSGGRCSACEGQGVRTVEMSFLPDVKVLCDVCNGQRFDRDTLSVRWRGKSVGDLLAMPVDDAVEFFASHPSVLHPLSLLKDVGLGYLTLGQQSPTLSGGEAQRIKLVTELARIRGDLSPDSAPPGRSGRRGQSLYILDEPTVGLHMADVEKLLQVLHRLVDGGNSVVVIEHNLDVMAAADWIIDMGPEAGAAGGRVVVAGTPAQVAARKGSRTGTALAEHLGSRHGA